MIHRRQRNHAAAVLRQFLQGHRPAIGFRGCGILRQVGRAQMAQRDQLAEIAVALHVRRQQHHRYIFEAVIPSGGPKIFIGPQSRNLSCSVAYRDI